MGCFGKNTRAKVSSLALYLDLYKWQYWCFASHPRCSTRFTKAFHSRIQTPVGDCHARQSLRQDSSILRSFDNPSYQLSNSRPVCVYIQYLFYTGTHATTTSLRHASFPNERQHYGSNTFFHLMIQTKHLSCIGCTRTFNALFRVQSTIQFPFSLLKHSRCKTLLFPSHCYMRIETHIFCVDKHLTGRNRVYMIT